MTALETILDERQAFLVEVDSNTVAKPSKGHLLTSGDFETRRLSADDPTVGDARIEVRYLKGLIEFLQEEFEFVERKMDALKDNITFDLLWRLFPEGSEVVFRDINSGCNCAGKVSPNF